jgi:hypothetical protein
MTEESPLPKRWPLTGVVSIEWVEGADPSDSDVEPYFGTFGVKTDRPLDRRRLIALLRWVVENEEQMLDEEEDQNGPSPD